MTARIKTTLVTARELQPGDLFSVYGPEYWSDALNRATIGERVYIRTNVDAGLDPSADDTLVYKIEIEIGKEKEQDDGPQRSQG